MAPGPFVQERRTYHENQASKQDRGRAAKRRQPSHKNSSAFLNVSSHPVTLSKASGGTPSPSKLMCPVSAFLLSQENKSP